MVWEQYTYYYYKLTLLQINLLHSFDPKIGKKQISDITRSANFPAREQPVVVGE